MVYMPQGVEIYLDLGVHSQHWLTLCVMAVQERVFDVRDDGRHGAASPEILSLINSPGSVIAENSSCVMEGITPPPTPPPPPRTARTARLQPLGGPGPRPGHYAVN